jgi:Zn-dependent peptidase ImmA (M78 family)
MELNQLIKSVKDYKLMTGGKISLSQAYWAGEEAAKGVRMTPSLNLTNLVRANGGDVHHIDYSQFKSFLDSGIDIFENSIYVRGEKDFDIILPTHAPLVERRFIIAHELGHYALHSIDAGKCYALRKGDGNAEKEADYFALGFLLPSGTFKKAYRRLNRNVGELSTAFLVPEDLVELRIKSLELS